MKDIEIILRIFALVEGWTNYKKPMKDFISQYMEKKINIDEEEQIRLKGIFTSAMDVISNQAGTGAFRMPGGRVNIAVLDSVVAGVILVGHEKIKNLNDALTELKKKPAYVEYVSNHTTDDVAVIGRLKMVMQDLSV